MTATQARLAALVGTIAALVAVLAWVDGIAPRFLASLVLVAVTLFTGMVLETTPAPTRRNRL